MLTPSPRSNEVPRAHVRYTWVPFSWDLARRAPVWHTTYGVDKRLGGGSRRGSGSKGTIGMRKVLWFGLVVLVALAFVAAAQTPGTGAGAPPGMSGPRIPSPPSTTLRPAGGSLKAESSGESTESSSESAMGRPVVIRPTKPEVTPTPAKTGAPIVVYLIAAFALIAAGGFCLRMSRATSRG
jgi:hypothetical protein